MEGSNWFDVLRWYYRDPQGALNYLNSMQRHRMYVRDGNVPESQFANPDSYRLANSKAEGGQYDASDITLTINSFIMPLPANVVTASPQLAAEPVEYDFSEE